MHRKFEIFVIFLLITLYSFSQPLPIAQKGVIDLRTFNFNEGKVVELKGEYEFYWHKLYNPADFAKQIIIPDKYITQPGYWTGTIIDSKPIPDTGFATFRLIILANPDKTPVLTLRMGEVLTAYNIWFNGKLIQKIGNVGNKNIFKPKTYSVVVPLNITSEKNELIFQVANYAHRENGIYDMPIVGESYDVLRVLATKFAFDLIIFGIVLIMSFYHFGLFLLHKKNIAALLFAIFAIIIAIRTIFTNNYVFNFFDHSVSWNFTYLVAYISLYTGVPVVFHFFLLLFEEKRYNIILKIAYVIAAVFIVTLFFGSYFYSRLIIYYEGYTLILVAFISFLLFKYIKQKRQGAIIISIGLLAVFATSINDMLYYQNFINSATLFPLGMFILILAQALSLAQIFTNAFIENEILNNELEYNNKHLEDIVKERTKEIEAQKQEIIQKNEELLQINEEINSQKEEIIAQRDLLEDQNIMITESISYASLIQLSLLPSVEEFDKYFESFVLFLPKNVVSGDFYWFSDKNPDYLFFAVGDCTGHGVPGAFISLIGIYLLNTIIIQQQIETPSKILEQLDLLFSKHLHKNISKVPDGMTITLLRFEKKALTTILATGSKQNIFVYNSETNQIDRHKFSSRSIGFHTKASDTEFKDMELILRKDDIIYFTTDGYIDQNNPQRERYGSVNFMKLLSEINNLSINQQKISIIRHFEEFSVGQPQRDDIAVVGFKFLKA